MLGILLIFFIGKYFYELAQDYNKHRWLYGIVGIVVYYGAGLLYGVIFGFLDVVFELNIDWDDTFGYNLLSIPIGIAACYGFYVFLEKRWKREENSAKDEIDDIGKLSN